jgi:serine/threonine protein kinase
MAYFGEPQILTWFVQMSMALHYVHSKGILHRDLKSQNIFLSHGHAKLGDFGIRQECSTVPSRRRTLSDHHRLHPSSGIVKVLDGSVTSAHTVIGTPYYLSPEVCKAQKYSYMSDVWSLGCVLYELCALQQAWTGNNLLAVVYKIVQASHPWHPNCPNCPNWP